MLWPVFPAAALIQLACNLFQDKGAEGKDFYDDEEATLLAYSWSWSTLDDDYDSVILTNNHTNIAVSPTYYYAESSADGAKTPPSSSEQQRTATNYSSCF